MVIVHCGFDRLLQPSATPHKGPTSPQGARLKGYPNHLGDERCRHNDPCPSRRSSVCALMSHKDRYTTVHGKSLSNLKLRLPIRLYSSVADSAQRHLPLRELALQVSLDLLWLVLTAHFACASPNTSPSSAAAGTARPLTRPALVPLPLSALSFPGVPTSK